MTVPLEGLVVKGYKLRVQSLRAVEVATEIGREVAARWADEVDRQPRFPAETVDALRRSGLLGATVPVEWGGLGATLPEASAAVAEISRHCANSGLILAMHLSQVAALVRHAGPAAREELLPRIAAGEMLVASANSEAGLGGARRVSRCALEPDGTGFRLVKEASTLSYGWYSDAVTATARAHGSAAPHDQVLAVCLRPDFSLEARDGWSALGMRGTDSRPFHLVARVGPEMVLGDYGSIFARTALPTSAVLLSSVWLGIAEAAAARAHSFVRADARRLRRSGGVEPEGVKPLRLAELSVRLHEMRDVVASGAERFERLKDTEEVETAPFAHRIDNVKVTSARAVVEVVQSAMAVCGMAGYLEDTPYSLGRLMRDALSAPLMVNNDRSLTAAGHSLLAQRRL